VGCPKEKKKAVGHPKNDRKAVSAVARPQGIEGSGMAGPGKTLGSPWPPLAIRSCYEDEYGVAAATYGREDWAYNAHHGMGTMSTMYGDKSLQRRHVDQAYRWLPRSGRPC
jgi:hypothetical protein